MPDAPAGPRCQEPRLFKSCHRVFGTPGDVARNLKPWSEAVEQADGELGLVGRPRVGTARAGADVSGLANGAVASWSCWASARAAGSAARRRPARSRRTLDARRAGEGQMLKLVHCSPDCARAAAASLARRSSITSELLRKSRRRDAQAKAGSRPPPRAPKPYKPKCIRKGCPSKVKKKGKK